MRKEILVNKIYIYLKTSKFSTEIQKMIANIDIHTTLMIKKIRMSKTDKYIFD